MGLLIFGILLFLFATLGVALFWPKAGSIAKLRRPVRLVSALAGVLMAVFGGMSYNDAGYCQHVRTIFGTESSVCATGWYFLGWGSSTQWPHFITVAHTNDASAQGSAILPPYPVRMADNWNGDVTQSTRFGIPQDEAQFIKMARDFRSPERLATTTLKPAITASLDSVSNLFTMEGYYANGERDQYKTEFRDAVIKGRAKVRQETSWEAARNNTFDQAANDLETTNDGDNVGENNQRVVRMVKVLDDDGNEIREQHGYVDYGITVSLAILENLDPDNRFEEQIQARKDAASRRIVAQEERREQEEQRLLAIQRGKTDVATRQAEAEVEQIQLTTEAETKRQLANIAATQLKEEAEIQRETAAINLEKARIEAETQQTLADAEAYEREVILAADNALAQKLDAWIAINKEWATAAASINVPSTVFAMGGGGTEGDATTGNLSAVEQFMMLMSASAASQLDVNTNIKAEAATE